MKNKLITGLLTLSFLLCSISTPVKAEECNHEFTKLTTVEATCTDAGYTVTQCVKCGKFQSDPVFTYPLGHTYDKATITITTENDKKYINGKCTRCNDNIKEYLTVQNCPHVHTTGGNIAIATCTESGGLQPTKCLDCDRILDHGNPTSSLGHDWNEGVIKVNPTKTSTGIMLYTCKRTGCSATKEVVIKKLEKDSADIIPTHKPVIETKPDIEIICSKVVVYGDSKKQFLSESLKIQIYNSTNDEKTIGVLYKIIKLGTVNKCTSISQLLDAAEHSDYSQKTIENAQKWIKSSIKVKLGEGDVKSDTDIFTVNAVKGFKKSIKVYVLRPANISGYQIKYSTNKKFKKAKTIKVTSKKDCYTIKRLAKKKTYYIKCRAYKYSTKTNKTIYSNWTGVMKTKTK